MKLSPWIAGAAALVPVAGAVIGSHMSTDIVGQRADVTQTLPLRTSVAHASATPRTQPRLPNHYAMATPEGVIEVHELTMRGRYQSRYRASKSYGHSYEGEIDFLELQWDSVALDARAQRALKSETAPLAQTPHHSIGAAQPETVDYTALEQARTGEDIQATTLQIADGVIEIQPAEPAIGNARVIDVAGELAALN